MEASLVPDALSKINVIFTCGLCKGYYREPCTIGECMHSFCKSCLLKYFVVDRHSECPRCKMNLKPSPMLTVRPDQTLQAMLNKLLPEVEQRDVEAERVFYETGNFYEADCEDDEPPDPEHALPASARLGPVPLSSTVSGAAYQGSRGGGQSGAGPWTGAHVTTPVAESIMFMLKPDRSVAAPLAPLSKSVLRTDAAVTINHLKKFVIKKLHLHENVPSDVRIKYRGSNLGAEHQLQFVFRTMAQHDSMPTFLYSLGGADEDEEEQAQNGKDEQAAAENKENPQGGGGDNDDEDMVDKDEQEEQTKQQQQQQ